MSVYCANNPVINVDPRGTCWVPVYSPCGGAQIGQKWMVMGPVPGAPYYCYKCGKYDLAYSPTYSNKKPEPKPEPSYIEKVGQTVVAALMTPELDIGAGYGLGGTVQISDYIGASARMSADLMKVKLSPQGCDIGSELKAEGGISVGPLDATWDETQWQSWVGLQDPVYTSGQSNKLTIFDIGGYFIIGASASLTIDTDYFARRMSEIWG